MRDLIVPELRRRWPSARIIHELPMRYSTDRIDLAAVTETEIISVEIKSSKDIVDRLEAQLRAFIPVSTTLIVALAPKWNEQLPSTISERGASRVYTQNHTKAQAVINRFNDENIWVWTVDAKAQTVECGSNWRQKNRPWPARMLDMLHVAELTEIATKHRACLAERRTTHYDLVTICNEMLSGREVTHAVCRALRSRAAFARASDPPISAQINPSKSTTQQEVVL